ncbi:MAG: hypothetical protein RSA53_03610 [Odoribacter sp.]
MKRVNFLCLVMLGLFFTACHSNDDTWGDWSRSFSFGGKPRTGAVTFTLNKVVYVGLGRNNDVEEQDKNLKDFWKFENNAWTPVASFPGAGRYGAVAFVVNVGGKEMAYVGTGYREYQGNETYYDDFYTFDGTTWSTTPVTKLPKPADRVDGGRRDAVAFSLNGKGYIGTGMTSGAQVLNDFYSFDPTKAEGSQWTVSGFNGDPRSGAVAFVVKGKAVVCLGASGNAYRYDVNVFDGTSWVQKAPLRDLDGRSWDNDYARIPRTNAVAFISSKNGGIEKGYIATGSGSYNRTCWEYNVDTDRWDEVTELPAAMSTRVFAIAFTLNDYGYVTTGGSNVGYPGDVDTWKFTPGIDEDDNNDYSPNE